MPLRYLLDATTLSDASRTTRFAGITDRMRRYCDSIATASVVWHEMLFGAWRMPPGQKRAAIEGFLVEQILPGLPILPYDQEAASWHAVERVRLTRLGTAPPYADGQIAAIAAVNYLVVVTSNVDDFKRFSGLRVEDWRK